MRDAVGAGSARDSPHLYAERGWIAGLLQLRAVERCPIRVRRRAKRSNGHTQLAATEYQGSGGLPGEVVSLPLMLVKS